MAGLNVGTASGSRRGLNHELPLVSFIDFLLCLVAFLLVTAVWSRLSRLNADALVPGTLSTTPRGPATELHVSVGEDAFVLKWQAGAAVLDTTRVAKNAQMLPDGSLRYPELGRVAGEQWRARGAHRSASDAVQDRAVLHTPNSVEFREITAVLDALAGTKRTLEAGRRTQQIPAFSVAFATD
jgi:hypothetical protein